MKSNPFLKAAERIDSGKCRNNIYAAIGYNKNSDMFFEWICSDYISFSDKNNRVTALILMSIIWDEENGNN